MHHAARFTVIGVISALSTISGSDLRTNARQVRPPVLDAKSTETRLRERVTRKIVPESPRDQPERAGVVVLEIVVEPDGIISHVATLDGPSDAVRRSVEDAVRRWRFAALPVPKSGPTLRVRGKLTFYYENSGDGLADQRARRNSGADLICTEAEHWERRMRFAAASNNPFRTVADVALIGLAAYFGISAVIRALRSSDHVASGDASSASDSHSGPVSPGARISVPGLVFSGQARMLLIALDPTSIACKRAEPFHRELLAAAQRRRFAAAIITPTDPTAAGLRSFGQGVNAFRADFRTLHIAGMPTVLFVDRTGVATGVWGGQVTPHEQRAILGIVEGLPPAVPYLNGQIADSAVTALVRSGAKFDFVDVRERDRFKTGHYPHAVNIPLDELEVRSRHELDQSKTIILDCIHAFTGECEVGQKIRICLPG